MARYKLKVYGGVDTRGRTHHAAAISSAGKILADREFPATPAGYRELIAWFRQLGDVIKIGVEGTGPYGAGLARALTAEPMAMGVGVQIESSARQVFIRSRRVPSLCLFGQKGRAQAAGQVSDTGGV